MISDISDVPLEKVKNLFCNETGYQTPKIDTRAAIFKDGKFSSCTKTTAPGHCRGWCDVLESVKSNTVKEVKGETGLDAEAVRLIAVQDRNKHNVPIYAYGVCKVFVLCRVTGGSFCENSETTEIAYFAPDEIPQNPAVEKTSREQIEMCFEADKDEIWQTMFD